MKQQVYSFDGQNPKFSKVLTFSFYSDPLHGWLKVPLTTIERYCKEFLEEITYYSYINNGNVFLEEDCDLSNFIKIMNKKGIHIKYRVNCSNKQSKIRNYNSFKPLNPVKLTLN